MELKKKGGLQKQTRCPKIPNNNKSAIFSKSGVLQNELIFSFLSSSSCSKILNVTLYVSNQFNTDKERCVMPINCSSKRLISSSHSDVFIHILEPYNPLSDYTAIKDEGETYKLINLVYCFLAVVTLLYHVFKFEIRNSSISDFM